MSSIKIRSINPKTEMLYSIKTLSRINQAYRRSFTLRQYDVDKVNKICVMLANKIISPTPSIGDKIILEGFSKSGNKNIVYNNGHIESLNYADTGKLNVCTSPDIPHIRENGNTSTSGGYWINIDPKYIQFVGYDSKSFWTWGFEGQVGNGAIYFHAPVKVFKYRNNELINI